MVTGKKWDADLSAGKELHPFLQKKAIREGSPSSPSKSQQLPAVKLVLPTWEPPLPSRELGNAHVNPGQMPDAESTATSISLNLSKRSVDVCPTSLTEETPGTTSLIEKAATGCAELGDITQRFLAGEDIVGFVEQVYPSASSRFPKVGPFFFF